MFFLLYTQQKLFHNSFSSETASPLLKSSLHKMIKDTAEIFLFFHNSQRRKCFFFLYRLRRRCFSHNVLRRKCLVHDKLYIECFFFPFGLCRNCLIHCRKCFFHYRLSKNCFFNYKPCRNWFYLCLNVSTKKTSSDTVSSITDNKESVLPL